MPAGALDTDTQLHVTTSPSMFPKQHQRAASLAHPSPQRMFPTDSSSSSSPSKASTPHIDPHHKDSVIEHVYTNNDGPSSMDRHMITPSPCMSESISLSDVLHEMRTIKQHYIHEITTLKTEMNTIKETHANEIASLKRQLQRQQSEISEWIITHEKSESWRSSFEHEAAVRRSKQDVILMDLSVQNQTMMTRIQELSQELAHTRARLPMVAATADAAAVSAAQAVASAKALAQRPQQRNNNEKKQKKPRKQSTPLLPTPPRHLWQTMPNPSNPQQQQQASQQPQSQSQPHSQPSTPRTVSPLHMTPPPQPHMTQPPSQPQQPTSRMIRFSSVPNAGKHHHHDSLSDVFGNYMDEDGSMIEDELTLYMKNRSRAQTTPPHHHTASPAIIQSQPSQSLQGVTFAF